MPAARHVLKNSNLKRLSTIGMNMIEEEHEHLKRLEKLMEYLMDEKMDDFKNELQVLDIEFTK
jgi:hypothetical protein